MVGRVPESTLALEARFLPDSLARLPGASVGRELARFTIPLGFTIGRSAGNTGSRGTILSPLVVSAYAVVPAASTARVRPLMRMVWLPVTRARGPSRAADARTVFPVFTSTTSIVGAVIAAVRASPPTGPPTVPPGAPPCPGTVGSVGVGVATV